MCTWKREKNLIYLHNSHNSPGLYFIIDNLTCLSYVPEMSDFQGITVSLSRMKGLSTLGL